VALAALAGFAWSVRVIRPVLLIALTSDAAPAPGPPADRVIVVRTDATPAERRGAQELGARLAEMTGAEVPIVVESGTLPPRAIVVGPCRGLAKLGIALDAAALGDEGFLLKSTGERLVVAGPGVRGTLYGCVTLLEKLGVRWLTPTITRVPRRAKLELPELDEIQLPDFEYREPFFAEAFDRDWAWRNKVNGHAARLDASCGGKIVYRPFVHSFDELVPRALFAEHPDYFPWIGGRRVGGPDACVQRCLTHPGVLRLAIEQVLRWIEESPDARIFSVSQNDCYQFCECDDCRALTAKHGAHSGLYLWFVNQVAEAVEEVHPDRLIDTLAYQFTEAPPRDIVPRRNVRVRLCPIACCQAHPYEQCSDPANVAFVKNLRSWSAITDTLYVWHYNADFAHYLMPFPDFDEFPAEARLYRRSGVKGLFFQGAYGAGGGGSDAELRSWVMARLLWDVEADADLLVTEWMRGVYGAAWQPMRAWFDRLHAEVRAPDRHLHVFDPPTGLFLAPAVLDAGEKLFVEAERLAGEDAVASEQVAKARLWLQYVRLAQGPRPAAEVDAFFAGVRRFGITQVAEGRSMEAYEADLRARAR
jgi:hypothetical protein